jgi:hypothetical protein
MRMSLASQVIVCFLQLPVTDARGIPPRGDVTFQRLDQGGFQLSEGCCAVIEIEIEIEIGIVGRCASAGQRIVPR